MYLTHQPERTAAAASYPYHEGMEGVFAFITNFGDAVQMSYRKGDTLYVPRNAVPVGVLDHRYSEPPTAIDCQFEPVNEEQDPLISKCVALLKHGMDHVFEAPTGWGKSVAGSVVACRLGQPTMIVVQKEDLMDSWYDALVNVLGIAPALVGKVQQNTCQWKGKQFVIGMAQSLILPDRYPEEMYRHFGLLILDEVHLMAADCFVNVCWKFPARHRLGMSATPDRTDGKWKVIEAHVGPVMVKGTLVPMAPKILVKKTGWKIPTHSVFDPAKGGWTKEKIPHSPGKMMLVTKAMASSEPRNRIITEFTRAAFEADRTTLILSDLKEYHLDRLFQMLTTEGISGEHIGYYVGGMTKLAISHTKKKRIVLGTYAMCSTGTNVPHWDTLVMATPRVNIKQSAGRVLRYVSGKKQPVILDLVDYDKIFSGFHYSRMKQYYGVGATVVQL